MKYGTDWKEDIAPDEDARFEALAGVLVAVQQARDAKYGEKGRALHRKGIAGLAARFTVRDDLASVLPPELHVGPFRPGASYDALLRFSNGTWDRAHDRAPDVRGIAIKLLGVGGKKVLTGTDDPRTQDFLLIHTPVVPSRSPDEFVEFVRIAAMGGGRAMLLPRLLWSFGPIRALGFLRDGAKALGRRFRAYHAERFYSATPYRFGPTAARWAMEPTKDHPVAEGQGRHLHTDAVHRAVRTGFAWDFQVQLYQDDEHTPIERNGVEWRAEHAPFLSIARLEVAPTDPDSAEAKAVAERIETLAFDPWHAVEELRPLGAFNRARKVAYFAATKSRGPAPEP